MESEEETMYFSPRQCIGIGVFCIGFSVVMLFVDATLPLFNVLCATCGGIAIGSANAEIKDSKDAGDGKAAQKQGAV